MIAITVALPAESSDFVALLQNAKRDSSHGVETIRGSLHGKAITLIHTGVGEKICRERLQALRHEEFNYLVSAGFAGGLNSELAVGDLLMAENFSSSELLQSPALDLPEEGLYLGKLVTAPGVIESEAQRQHLANESGADAVDMETQFIAEACAKSTIPMLSLRAISDTPSEPFPAPAQVLFDLQRQKTDFARLSIYLLTHPAALPRLNAFRQRIARARKNLTAALERIVRADLLSTP
jgi:adenosylhomocysteine nucleosidase